MNGYVKFEMLDVIRARGRIRARERERERERERDLVASSSLDRRTRNARRVFPISGASRFSAHSTADPRMVAARWISITQ